MRGLISDNGRVIWLDAAPTYEMEGKTVRFHIVADGADMEFRCDLSTMLAGMQNCAKAFANARVPRHRGKARNKRPVLRLVE